MTRPGKHATDAAVVRSVGGRCLLLIGPGVFDRLAVSGVVRTEGEKLQAILSGLEGPRRCGRYAYGVQRTEVDELVVELDPPLPLRTT